MEKKEEEEIERNINICSLWTPCEYGANERKDHVCSQSVEN